MMRVTKNVTVARPKSMGGTITSRRTSQPTEGSRACTGRRVRALTAGWTIWASAVIGTTGGPMFECRGEMWVGQAKKSFISPTTLSTCVVNTLVTTVASERSTCWA